MCGRFNVIDDPMTQLLMEITGQMDWHIETELNIAPTQQVPVIRFGDSLSDGKAPDEKAPDGKEWSVSPMRWWLVPYWSPEPSTKYSMFNAKSETLKKSRAFSEPFKKRRCIVPVTGYYEWKKEGGIKVPYYIESADDSGFAFAGLWDRWHRGDQVVESFTIITAAAPEGMKWLHHRIPVHLTSEQAKTWVNAGTAEAELDKLMLPELRTTIQVTPVSTYVNNARNKDDRCIEPLGERRVIH